MPPLLIEVSTAYDSLSRVVEDSQSHDPFGSTLAHATCSQFTSHPVSQQTFPDGRKIDNAYDALYRRTSVAENSSAAEIANWQFFGPSRVAEVKYAANNGAGANLYCSMMNNDRTRSAVQSGQSSPAWGNQSSDRLGYDGAGRMITKRFLVSGIDAGGGYTDTSAIMGQTTSYDKSSNKFFERELHCEDRSHLYQPFENGEPQGGYDSINRLRQYQRGVLDDCSGYHDAGGGSIAAAIDLPNTDKERTYDLDGLGNWRRTDFTPVGTSEVNEVRQHNGLNEITRITQGASQDNFSYDGSTGASNGNLKDDGIRTYIYDAFNRLLNVTRKSDGAQIARYTYDALGRRVTRVVSNGGLSGNIPDGTTEFYYHGGNSQCCEERNGSNEATRQYLWGTYVDELIQQKNLTAQNNFSAGAELYPLQDLLYRTTGLTDSAGVIREAYDCDAYGNTLVFRKSGSPPAQITFLPTDAQVDNPTCEFIYTGRRYDAETEIYFYRARYYVPEWERFTGRDPLLFVDSLNLYCYAGSAPEARMDPSGRIIAIAVPVVGGAVVLTTAEIVALSFGMTLLACLADEECSLAMKEAISDVVEGMGNIAMAVMEMNCKAKYQDYKLAESLCSKCVPKKHPCFWDRLARCVHSQTQVACWGVAVALRLSYIVSGCDFVLNDAWDRHVGEIGNKGRALAKCELAAGLNCGINAF